MRIRRLRITLCETYRIRLVTSLVDSRLNYHFKISIFKLREHYITFYCVLKPASVLKHTVSLHRLIHQGYRFIYYSSVQNILCMILTHIVFLLACKSQFCGHVRALVCSVVFLCVIFRQTKYVYDSSGCYHSASKLLSI